MLNAYSYSLDTASGSTQALQDVCRPFGGQCPDAVFACAGSSKPMFFVEMDEQDLVNGMVDSYWVQAWTAWVNSSTSYLALVLFVNRLLLNRWLEKIKKVERLCWSLRHWGICLFLVSLHIRRGNMPCAVC